MKIISILLSLILAFGASSTLVSCSAGGGVNANVGGVGSASVNGSGSTRRR